MKTSKRIISLLLTALLSLTLLPAPAYADGWNVSAGGGGGGGHVGGGRWSDTMQGLRITIIPLVGQCTFIVTQLRTFVWLFPMHMVQNSINLV